MRSSVLTHMRSELEKLAKTRWQQEAAAGNLGAQELSRLPTGAALAHAPVVGPGYTKMVRDKMWGPGETDLSPASLEKHRRLNQLLGHKDVDLLGGDHKNVPKTGPATVDGKVMVAPDSGQYIRRMTEGPVGLAETVANTRGMPFLSSPKPEDASIYRGVAAHEGAEKALTYGAVHDQVPSRFVSGHMGGMPQVAEQLATYRDPDAQKVWQKARQMNPDDQFVANKMRQFGSRMDSPMAIGSKQHVALEKAVAGYTPVMPGALMNRAAHAMAEVGHGPNLQSSLLQQAEKHLPAAGSWLEKRFPNQLPTAGQAGERAAASIGKMIRPSMKDSANLGAVLKGLPSRVRL